MHEEASEGFKIAWGEAICQDFLEIVVKVYSKNLVFLEGFSENISKVADVVRVFIPSFKLH